MKKSLLGMSLLAAVATLGSASAQIIVDEQFNYADQPSLTNNWTMGANNPLTLNVGSGNASIAATGINPNLWRGSTFSLTPSDVAPIRLTGDITAPGTVGSVGTIGLRTGANPLFEMGLYRTFDNVQTGPDTNGPLSPVGTGIGVRTLSIGPDQPGQDWIKMGDYFNGTAKFEATFTTLSVTTRVDLNNDGSWDLSYTETGTTPIGAFTDLRVHSPAAASPLAAGGITVDNIRLEVITVPEPSTYALVGLGAAAMLAVRRRKA